MLTSLSGSGTHSLLAQDHIGQKNTLVLGECFVFTGSFGIW